ncbi:nitrogen fixation protein FixH [Aquabacterium lacunae]|uniref:Nitrogen fixation protein FixH n=1 Tax=Aquabacterium lacunae TaxID=2528630 RepID=A0A4Q9GVJ8_9BURK|nr:nitrogen fixation protein FixH [Aquabacterium lacunae]TBO28707.1 nitrogen fixation protein FixH [Aquabacterium lacunae]
MSRNDKNNSRDTKPWWKYPMVWMIIGGPAIVVVAGISTAVIAYRHVDPVLDASKPADNAGELPALQGRNKAAETATQPAER